jgi:UDP-2,4-diacetamido-2,4,6-trideoxy-beta-L-altropyranose hydrolase
MTQKKAFFRVEASPLIGAGHAMRCGVLADALSEKEWICYFVTSQEAYDFIPALSRFERVDPDKFYESPVAADLLVVDHYNLDASYESHFRPHAQKIMVIDDLADRPHDCDILLDQTYGRDSNDYSSLVPMRCEILAGSEYVLLRPEFVRLRPQALEKRKNTTGIKKILVSMGGSDPKNFTLEALKLIKESRFKGDIDVALGFSAPHIEELKAFVETMQNQVVFHINANMAQLVYEADLAIGAGGTSVWERCCLGLPSVLMLTANNQQGIYKILLERKNVLATENFNSYLKKGQKILGPFTRLVDGLGCNKLLLVILRNKDFKDLSLKSITLENKEMIWQWQNIKEVRQYFNNSNAPTFEQHELWFVRRLNQYENPYWIICDHEEAVGSISLTYNKDINGYDLSWYVLPAYQGKGLGSKSLRMAVSLVAPLPVRAVVKEENIASHRSLEKAGFIRKDHNSYISQRDITG